MIMMPVNVRGFGAPIFAIDGTTNVSEFRVNRMILKYPILSATAIYGMNAANGVILVARNVGGR